MLQQVWRQHLEEPLVSRHWGRVRWEFALVCVLEWVSYAECDEYLPALPLTCSQIAGSERLSSFGFEPVIPVRAGNYFLVCATSISMHQEHSAYIWGTLCQNLWWRWNIVYIATKTESQDCQFASFRSASIFLGILRTVCARLWLLCLFQTDVGVFFEDLYTMVVYLGKVTKIEKITLKKITLMEKNSGCYFH